MREPVAVTIGTFDAVHVGHAALIERARRLVDRPGAPGRVIALVFDPHPLTTLRPVAAPPRLSTFRQRFDRLRSLGADHVVRLTPDPATLALSPEQFIERVVAEHHPTVIVEGRDFRFGHRRSGDVDTLAALGARHAFRAEIVDPVDSTLTDQTIVTASSSIARWLIAQGRVSDAAIVLGRPYELVGRVIRGDRRGREIGCPTANLETPLLMPRDAVYAALAALPDGRAFPAAVSVGDKPTFNGRERVVEAHLLDWTGPVSEGRDEYGWELRLSFLAWLRDQVRYDSIDALLTQIALDIHETRRIVSASAAAAGRSTPSVLQEAAT